MKKKKTYRVTQRSATKTTSDLKRSLRKVNWKLIGAVAGLTVLFTAIYQICIALELAFIMPVYAVLLAVLFVCYFICNGGFSRKVAEYDELPHEWDEAKKTAYIEGMTARKKKAKIFLVFIIPILLCLIFDLVYLFYLDPLITEFRRYMLLNKL